MTSEPEAPPPTKSRRRRFNLSLRALMLAVLIVGGLMGWQARRVSIQRRAVAAIEAMGGQVIYDWETQDGHISLPIEGPPGPNWLRKVIGDDYFQTPTAVDLTTPEVISEGLPRVDWLLPVLAFDRLQSLNVDRDVTDADLARLASSRGLVKLALTDTTISDAGLALLGTLDRLESLDLQVEPGPGPPVTGKGLIPLARLTRLRSLSLFGVKFTSPADLAPLGKLVNLLELDLQDSPSDEACLDHLRGLKQLRQLGLRDTKITDAGLARVAKISDHLESLSFQGGNVTDAGLAALANQTKLEGLALGRVPRITDVGLARLCDHPKLTSLNLPGSAITDAGLVHLARLPRLSRLRLIDTAITDAGANSLGASANLFTLDLSGTRITDAGLLRLAGLRKLSTLRLARTAITDAGLPALAGLPKLVRLDVRGTRVTLAALDALRSALPKLKIQADASPVP